jgi:hypothetical protein
MRVLEEVCGLTLVVTATYVVTNGVFMFLEYVDLI